MKRFLTLALAIVMVVMCFALVSCGHECEFKAEWSSDATHHWHDCTGKKCELVDSKAEHTWNEGEITTPATQAADGVKTFTCTTCSATKTEPVVYTGLTKTEWDAAFGVDNFKNFYYKEFAVVKATGFTVETTMEYYFTDSKAKLKMTMAGQSDEETLTNKTQVNMQREALIDSLLEITKHGDYTYDAATKTYKANKSIYFEELDESTSNITLKFDDTGKLIEIVYIVSTTQSGTAMEATSTVTIEYGNVTL